MNHSSDLGTEISLYGHVLLYGYSYEPLLRSGHWNLTIWTCPYVWSLIWTTPPTWALKSHYMDMSLCMGTHMNHSSDLGTEISLYGPILMYGCSYEPLLRSGHWNLTIWTYPYVWSLIWTIPPIWALIYYYMDLDKLPSQQLPCQWKCSYHHQISYQMHRRLHATRFHSIRSGR